MNNKSKIITATTSDAEAISNLVNSAYRGEGSRKGWTTEADLIDGTRTSTSAVKDLIQRKNTKVLAFLNGDTIAGCVELVKDGNEMYLGMLSVQPDLQGSGIGKQLLYAAEAEGRLQQCEKITMTVISIRSELIDWYKRHGYVNTGKQKPFPTDNPHAGTPRQPLHFVVLEKVLKTAPGI